MFNLERESDGGNNNSLTIKRPVKGGKVHITISASDNSNSLAGVILTPKELGDLIVALTFYSRGLDEQ